MYLCVLLLEEWLYYLPRHTVVGTDGRGVEAGLMLLFSS